MKKRPVFKVGQKVYIPRDRLPEFWVLWTHWKNSQKTMADKLPWASFVYKATGIPETMLRAFNSDRWTAMLKMLIEMEGEDYPGVADQRIRDAEAEAKGAEIKAGLDEHCEEADPELLEYCLAIVAGKRQELMMLRGLMEMTYRLKTGHAPESSVLAEKPAKNSKPNNKPVEIIK